MQEFGTIPGLAASILGGAGAGGGRLGGYPQPPAQQQQAAPVKCPRCHSTDTKFCYYNNYNLTQPRHFCKSCRRYWTKGGVLRNVPVGGGCRKPKCSSSSSSKLSAGAAHHKEPSPRRPSAADASTSAVFPNSTLLASLPDPNPNPNPTRSFDSAMAMGAPLVHATAIYADATAPAAAGSFTSLISPGSAPAILERSSFSDPPPLPLRPHPSAAEGIGTQPGLMDQAAVAGMDWPGASVYPVLFDLSAAVDPAAAAAYWSHGHWGDADPALYLS